TRLHRVVGCRREERTLQRLVGEPFGRVPLRSRKRLLDRASRSDRSDDDAGERNGKSGGFHWTSTLRATNQSCENERCSFGLSKSFCVPNERTLTWSPTDTAFFSDTTQRLSAPVSTRT